MDIPAAAALLPEIQPRQNSSTPANGAKAPAADFQSFLTLLTAQLRNQDPMQPIESTQFVAQLASFSTVEQLVGTNARLDLLASRAEANDLASLSGWIGRLASATDGRFRAEGAETFQVPPLPGAESADAVIFSSGGAEIDRFAVSQDIGGQATWPGPAAGTLVPGTELRIELVYSAGGSVLERRPASIFREVTGIRGTPDGPALDLAGGGTLPPGDVAELRSSAGGQRPPTAAGL